MCLSVRIYGPELQDMIKSDSDMSVCSCSVRYFPRCAVFSLVNLPLLLDIIRDRFFHDAINFSRIFSSLILC